MTKLRFYEHFAVANGTIWLGLMLLAFCTGTHINTGLFGAIGFPLLSLFYAFFRRAQNSGSDEHSQPRHITMGEQGADGNPH